MLYSTAFLLGLTRLLEQGFRSGQKGLIADLYVLFLPSSGWSFRMREHKAGREVD